MLLPVTSVMLMLGLTHCASKEQSAGLGQEQNTLLCGLAGAQPFGTPTCGGA